MTDKSVDGRENDKLRYYASIMVESAPNLRWKPKLMQNYVNAKLSKIEVEKPLIKLTCFRPFFKVNFIPIELSYGFFLFQDFSDGLHSRRKKETVMSYKL